MSKVPKNMGEEVRKEFQRALEEWRNEVFDQGATGYLKSKTTQKIERSEK